MPRAIWSGSISFGLINIPVKLFSAVSEKSVRFNQIDTRNGSRIRTRKVNAEDGSEVPADVIAKGYEVSKGRYVIVTEDELASLQPRATHTIDLEEFVDLDAIDPMYFDGAYWVAPDDRAAKPYTLLVEAMEQAGKVAVARFVMRAKQYVAVMRPRDGHLVLSMMVYDDEINPVSEIPEFDQLEDVELTERELTMAEQLIDSLSTDFRPEAFHDTYREELLDLIHAKDAGEERVVAEVEGPEEDKVIDLMAALEASVAAARDARGRHPSTGGADADEAEDEAPARSGRSSGTTKRAAAKPSKATAKKASGGTTKKAAAKKTTKSTAKKATAKKTPARKTA
ncbi:non-homologous end joining protein Ku [Dermatobacter hominis]|uniref:non-homologous end joining protein Ku n=1 Tax=Dermatobacter hominis TaxID=2884263 RepID=UPI001D103E1D|nr:Ku protein [Dermatobacter hominis]UDY35550.1 Ku protein [Dermatobacter hominis]